MERKRITLDSPIFTGTLRYQSRGAVYARRPLQARTVNDVSAARRPAPTEPTPAQKNVVHERPVVRVEDIRPHAPPMAQPTAQAPVIQMPRIDALQPPVRPANPTTTVPNQERISAAPVLPTAQASSGSMVQDELPDRRGRFRVSRTAVLYGMAAVVFVAGVLVSINGLQANRHVAAQVQTIAATKSNGTGSDTAGATPPSTTKPSASAIRNYTVAPNLPKYIDIPKLGIHARILSQGVDANNELDVPANIHDTGWYNASGQPGQLGAMLIDGHSGIGKTEGVFHYLSKLSANDPIVITRGDGKTYAYTVVKVQTVDTQNVDMQSMVVSADKNKPGLNLITCTGRQIPGTTELNKRVQVYAVLR